MDQGSMDPHPGPGPWTTLMDRVHGPPVMGWVHGHYFFKIMRNEQNGNSAKIRLKTKTTNNARYNNLV